MGWLERDEVALPQAAGVSAGAPEVDEAAAERVLAPEEGLARAEDALARSGGVDAGATDTEAPAVTGKDGAESDSADADADGAVVAAVPAEITDEQVGSSPPAASPSEGGDPSASEDSGTAAREDRDEAAPPEWRLTRARELMDAGYITYPPEDNAVAYLERLLAADPGNPRALEMLDEAGTRLIDAAVRAHDQGLDYEARNTLEEVFGFDPADERAHRLWREWVGTAR